MWIDSVNAVVKDISANILKPKLEVDAELSAFVIEVYFSKNLVYVSVQHMFRI